MHDDAAQPRTGEELDVDALSRWLGVPVAVRQYPGGHSNLTYLVHVLEPPGTYSRPDDALPQEMVLRRPPKGPVAPKAHDMAREFHVLEAVHPRFPLAPRPLRLCQDSSVLGCDFFLMELKPGRILRNSAPPLQERVPLSRASIETLALLHSVDTSQPPIAGLGKPEGFLERQVSGWGGRWGKVELEPVREIRRVLPWLEQNVPAPSGTTLVHNDFKLDNLVLAEDTATVTAVLDWEMATIGDPLFDLGVALTYWCHAPRLSRITAEPGFWDRDTLIQAYAHSTGRDVSRLPWYEVFGIFKLAVIAQQIFFRWRQGQTADARFAHFDEMVRELGATAARLLP
ncbi:phosphotransferase family protein [Paludibaculum fermentans]|uniref:Phosphotransferase family protein n=1 Tax=Paludibaculum fermentans TaxID=1473598 RepID=A0A7S7NX33_PALFE|nr:phosphotransferase family protein [Paludibaculum fermentans]QOY91393.1 phosphotransferase family protein [Paludibaculum fermentans]